MGERIGRFEDLESWKEERELVRSIYEDLASCRDFSFRNQIQRAAVSVMANIAEGFGRGSARECAQFFVIAGGSTAEVKSLGYVALDLGYLRGEQFETLSQRCERIRALLNGFLRRLRERSTERER